jgi:hypothetical protein
MQDPGQGKGKFGRSPAARERATDVFIVALVLLIAALAYWFLRS